MKLFFKNIFLIYTLIFGINFQFTKAHADAHKNVLWTMEATINNKQIDLFYCGSNFSFLDFEWREINQKVINENKKTKRVFIPDQKWTNENKKFFIPKDSLIYFREIDPNNQERKYYESQHFPEILIAKNQYINFKNEDEIIVKKIYSNIEGETFFLDKNNFERVKKSYKSRFQINAKIYIDNLESMRIMLFLNINKEYLPGEILKIIRNEGEKILIEEKDHNQFKQSPPQGFHVEYNLIRNNFEYFKNILLYKYGIILIEFYSSGC